MSADHVPDISYDDAARGVVRENTGLPASVFTIFYPNTNPATDNPQVQMFGFRSPATRSYGPEITKWDFVPTNSSNTQFLTPVSATTQVRYNTNPDQQFATAAPLVNALGWNVNASGVYIIESIASSWNIVDESLYPIAGTGGEPNRSVTATAILQAFAPSSRVQRHTITEKKLSRRPGQMTQKNNTYNRELVPLEAGTLLSVGAYATLQAHDQAPVVVPIETSAIYLQFRISLFGVFTS